MPTVKEKKIQQLVALADDGFDATVDCFSTLTTEFIKDYAKVNLIVKYKSVPNAFSALLQSVLQLKKVRMYDQLLGETGADQYVMAFFPEYIGLDKERKLSTPRMILYGLVQLAKIYQRISILGTRVGIGQTLFDELHAELFNLQENFEGMQMWAKRYTGELKPLIERNHINDMGPLISSIEREMEAELAQRGGTTRRIA